MDEWCRAIEGNMKLASRRRIRSHSLFVRLSFIFDLFATIQSLLHGPRDDPRPGIGHYRRCLFLWSCLMGVDLFAKTLRAIQNEKGIPQSKSCELFLSTIRDLYTFTRTPQVDQRLLVLSIDGPTRFSTHSASVGNCSHGSL